MPRDRSQPLDQQQAAGYLTSIDPGAARAELAVAQMEGWSGEIGDQGTSYGPWQLHKGGAYPRSAPQDPQAANRWAWSKPGISYADDAMRRAVPNLEQLPPAMQVDQIVRRFERPANPNAEVAGALQKLGGVTPTSGRGARPSSSSGGGGVDSFLGSVAANIPGLGLVWQAGQGIGSVADFLKVAAWLVNPLTWLRFVEGFFGFLLILAGLYFLAKEGRQAATASRLERVPGVKRTAELVGAGAAAGSSVGRRSVKRRRQRQQAEDEAAYHEHRRGRDADRLERAQQRIRAREQKQAKRRRLIERSRKHDRIPF